MYRERRKLNDSEGNAGGGSCGAVSGVGVEDSCLMLGGTGLDRTAESEASSDGLPSWVPLLLLLLSAPRFSTRFTTGRGLDDDDDVAKGTLRSAAGPFKAATRAASRIIQSRLVRSTGAAADTAGPAMGSTMGEEPKSRVPPGFGAAGEVTGVGAGSAMGSTMGVVPWSRVPPGFDDTGSVGCWCWCWCWCWLALSADGDDGGLRLLGVPVAGSSDRALAESGWSSLRLSSCARCTPPSSSAELLMERTRW